MATINTICEKCGQQMTIVRNPRTSTQMVICFPCALKDAIQPSPEPKNWHERLRLLQRGCHK